VRSGRCSRARGARRTIAIVETIDDGVCRVTQRMLSFFIQGVEHELAHLLDVFGGCPGKECLAVVGEGRGGCSARSVLSSSRHRAPPLSWQRNL